MSGDSVCEMWGPAKMVGRRIVRSSCSYHVGHDGRHSWDSGKEASMPLDGLGIYNALHEYAKTNNSGRYDRSSPMDLWAKKGKTAELPDFKVEVVEYVSDGSDTYGYDEHYQGWVGKCFVVFKITPSDGGEVVYYKLEGEVDSYNGEHWDGKFLPVSPKVENVTVWKWE